MRSATGAHNHELVGASDQGAGSSGPPETESLAVGRPLGSIQQSTGPRKSRVWSSLSVCVKMDSRARRELNEEPRRQWIDIFKIVTGVGNSIGQREYGSVHGRPTERAPNFL
jgi:hypothetical protein